MSQTLAISNKTLQELHDLRQSSKFLEDTATFYPGAPNESIRVRCQAVVDALIDRLIAGLLGCPEKQFVLQAFQHALSSFDNEETEERDRVMDYLEQIMDITGIESSDGLLNTWRYGFDPTQFT